VQPELNLGTHNVATLLIDEHFNAHGSERLDWRLRYRITMPTNMPNVRSQAVQLQMAPKNKPNICIFQFEKEFSSGLDKAKT
jgi:hypothetical protein